MPPRVEEREREPPSPEAVLVSGRLTLMADRGREPAILDSPVEAPPEPVDIVPEELETTCDAKDMTPMGEGLMGRLWEWWWGWWGWCEWWWGWWASG